jgi:TPR repeat protein
MTARALARLERAVAAGDRDSMLELANKRSSQRAGVARAIVLYRAAFRLGEPTAAFNLACTYQNLGRYREAVAWYRRADAAGDISAGFELARAELYGLGTRRNVRGAFARLERLAARPTRYWPRNSDRIEAILVMADALITGWPVRRDYRKGRRWLARAAALGSDIAKAMLSSI